MAGIRFQALSGMVVPKAYRVIQGRGENELSIRRKLYKRPVICKKMVECEYKDSVA